jgi:hypothetical protein
MSADLRGDFSRIRFDRGKGYTAVLDQQGRVALDADANEQRFIDAHLRSTETQDVIGEYGGPVGDAGFAITVPPGGGIQIGPGRYYVAGLLCENVLPENVPSLSYDAQPYLLDAKSAADLLAELTQTGSALQVYLEVWERLVTDLDDPCLREPALGMADTTARLQTVWRVVAEFERPVPPVGQTSGLPTSATMSPCCQAMYDVSTPPAPGGMSAQTGGPSADCGCDPVAAAGYQGVENQTYRVEIHNGGDETTATFKWSRENGSVVSAVTAVSGSTITVNSLGPDANLGFQSQQWVELSDDTDVFGEPPNQPGTLYQVSTLQPADPSVTLAGTVTAVNPAQNARLRRWDQSGPSAPSSGIPLSAGTWITLENGIEVCFAAGNYQAGDYWTIPARTATGTIEWPPCGSDGNAFQPPHRTQVYRAPLACIQAVQIRRPPFPRPTSIPAAPLEVAEAELEIAAPEREILPEAFLPRPTVGYKVDDCRLLFEPLTAFGTTAQGPAIHVKSVSWVNDDFTTLDRLVANGLTVVLDQVPSGPINGANFIVTVEPVLASAGEGREALTFVRGNSLSLLPSTLLRSVTIVDSTITVNGETLTWNLPWDTNSGLQMLTVLLLDALILPGATVGFFARARVKLLGDMIFGADATRGGLVHLDGRALGQPALRADGKTPRIDLQLPSGDGSISSDLDGWFYLAPTLTVESVSFEYDALTVVAGEGTSIRGVEVGSDPGAGGTVLPAVNEATVTLNYPPVVAGTISLVLGGNPPGGEVATVVGSVPVVVGEPTVTVPVQILSNPGPEITLTLDLTANFTPAIGPGSSAEASFTLTGAPEQVIIK